MKNTRSLKLCILLVAAIPFLGPTCVKEKTIELGLKGEIDTVFQARGSDNTDFGTSVYDVKDNLDLEGALLENDIDASSIIGVSVRALFYKIVLGQAGRQITDADMTIQFEPDPQATLATDFSGDCSAATDWIDITPLLNTAGVNEINAFLARVVASLKSGAPATADPTVGTFVWSGISTPTAEATHFDWSAKLEVNVVYTITADFPDF